MQNDISNSREHSESSLKIYFTNEHSRFKMIEGNRQLNETKIKKIMADIESGTDVLMYYPIHVKEAGGKLNIIDGQHRFYIARKLQRPVHYIIMKSALELPEIAKVNSNVEKWKAKDFLNCYIQLGNRHYETLQKFMDKHELSLTLSVQLLAYGCPDYSGLGDAESFQHGKFEVKALAQAERLADIAGNFKAFKGYKGKAFYLALHKIIMADKVKMADLIEKVVKNIDKLSLQSNSKQYIENLESIYNSRRPERIIICD